MNLYQQRILDHYHNPKNSGKPDKFTHTLKLENLSCGDVITVYLNIENDIVTDVHYEAEGCVVSIASASIISENLRNKTLEEIKKLDTEYVKKLLGIDLTTSRIRCANLALEAVQKASTPSLT